MQDGPPTDVQAKSATNFALIVEDDRAARLILQHWLKHLGYEVLATDDGNQAWSAMTGDRPPKLILLDWAVPGLDGIELCRRLRAQAASYYTYVIMIAGRQSREDVACALEAGADDYLAKPFAEVDLEARLTVASRILALQDKLIEDRDQFRILATRDWLTDVWSRPAFLDLLARELDRCARQKSDLGLLFLDLDHFKSINDAHGHLVGDLVLKEIARRLSRSLRSYDFIGRYGGEEFCIALPGCPSAAIGKRAEMIRLAISQEPVSAQGIQIPVTLSIGAASIADRRIGLQDLVAIADVALYRAKSAGRNCTVYCTNRWSEGSVPPELMKTRCGDCEAHTPAACIVK
ncbi:diguanylate cyclase [Occallatibacter savannae]|uniref:GGDEF domain-containing response regulator n=1 Tax=Occallatibacter savannae TaxID=1002691 RepID=UPI0013A5A6F3|nr:diguanylate cyclase [Occallatibacter savannae]